MFTESARYLKSVRKISNTTQRELANGIGYQQNGQFISNAERGKCFMPPKTFKKIRRLMPAFNPTTYIECVAQDKYQITIKKMIKEMK
jgi:transcriptional regulator with XRE-family HTH domain